jgi:hypothetical protein
MRSCVTRGGQEIVSKKAHCRTEVSADGGEVGRRWTQTTRTETCLPWDGSCCCPLSADQYYLSFKPVCIHDFDNIFKLKNVKVRFVRYPTEETFAQYVTKTSCGNHICAL